MKKTKKTYPTVLEKAYQISFQLRGWQMENDPEFYSNPIQTIRLRGFKQEDVRNLLCVFVVDVNDLREIMSNLSESDKKEIENAIIDCVQETDDEDSWSEHWGEWIIPVNVCRLMQNGIMSFGGGNKAQQNCFNHYRTLDVEKSTYGPFGRINIQRIGEVK